MKRKFQLFTNKVTYHMKSGAVLTGYATSFTRHVHSNDLTGVEWKGDRNMPFYTRLADVSAIEIDRALNWRNFFLAPR